MKIFLPLLLFISVTAFADAISGRVVGISDGDTLTVLNESKKQYIIRLAAIDAPEKNQAFGQFSKQNLSDLCFGKQAEVEVVDMDRYGRSVGVVTCDGVKANESMLQKGAAWVYVKYAKDFSHYFELESNAKERKLGLWSDPKAIPPWEWRKMNRNNR
jgi:micrococcal nuclease